ncbi:MAG TPA: acyl carrier protein [Candidatus Binatia bacterium]|jgi:acyl carrier protein|nr:acyl carrier protein [Candidatus Binatia bacterium]
MQIENQIKQFILKNLYFAEDNALDDNASFLETGVVDSTGVMELVAFIQAEFGVTVKPQEIVVENFDSVRKVARFVRRKLSPTEQGDIPAVTPLAPQPSTVGSR